jgi:tRNA modification GTPase
VSATTQRDTIVALATAPGRAALAVIRLSGPDTLAILGAVFRRERGRAIPPRRPVLGWFLDRGGASIDRGIALLFPAPHSYTGDDLAELTVHGAPAVVRELIAACAALGARPARPGEFTLRALESGKVDLAQAEAVRDLVEAATLEQARVAARQLGGEVSATIGPLAEQALDLLADVEAGLDFAEEEENLALAPATIAARCAEIVTRLDAALGDSENARRVREGARVVLRGAPNAGKSSLFNQLVRADRVIVTDEPGTTRDLIEELVVLDGLPVVLVDAAGVGAAVGAAEREGERRALSASGRADLVLEVYDLSLPERPGGEAGPRRLRVGTHADLPAAGPPAPGTIAVNARTGAGVDPLRAAIAAALEAPGDRPLESVALATDRHRDAARRAGDRLREAARVASTGGGAELAAVEIRAAVGALHEILGEVGPEDLLERIFARFCIGK